MGGERHRLEPDRHGRRSVPLLGGVVVGRDQRRDLPRRLRHLLIQPRPSVGPLRRSRLSLELQLFFLQQEAQAHRFLHLQSRESVQRRFELPDRLHHGRRRSGLLIDVRLS
jgi:hypothetical protein